jgi:dolichyl-diphosphooligosaccharide--protein glycosyltransferase
VWSLVILAATLAVRRLAVFFALNVALLTGYLSWLVLQFAGFKEIAAEPAEIPKSLKKGKERKRQKVSLRRTGSRANMALGIILVFFITFLPNISPAINTASQARFAPSDAWCESLSWLKDNTPDPFGDPNFYYDFYETPFRYPETAYGVVAWWDYGYWIIRIGHRLPNCDPGGGAREVVARFFTAQDEASANEILDQWGSKYVIVDNAIAKVVGGKFQALATFSGNSPDKFYGIYYQLKDNTLEPVLLFYPEYYRSFIVRLYNFDGGRVIARSSIVISSEEKVTPDGQFYRQITDAKSFGSYEDARAYITSQKSGNYKVVSPNPYVSPVTLPALNHYKLIYSSKGSVTDPGIGTVPEVKIFEYTK